MELDRIIITGARQHNLKNVTVEIPKKKLVILTGVSGSGKSSLAFDTLYAEGQRRYIESLNAYARQFLGQMDKPLYDSIRGLAPTISIEQKAAERQPALDGGDHHRDPRLPARALGAGRAASPATTAGAPCRSSRPSRSSTRSRSCRDGTKFLLLAPAREGPQGRAPRGAGAGAQGGLHPRARGRRSCSRSRTRSASTRRRSTPIDAVVDRLIAKAGMEQRLHDSVETALRYGGGHRGGGARGTSPRR